MQKDQQSKDCTEHEWKNKKKVVEEFAQQQVDQMKCPRNGQEKYDICYSHNDLLTSLPVSWYYRQKQILKPYE